MPEVTLRIRRIARLLDFLTDGHSVPLRKKVDIYVSSFNSASSEIISDFSLTRDRVTISLPSAPAGDPRHFVSIELWSRATRKRFARLGAVGVVDDIVMNRTANQPIETLEVYVIPDWANALIGLRNDLASGRGQDPDLLAALNQHPVNLFDHAYWKQALQLYAEQLVAADDALPIGPKDKVASALTTLTLGRGVASAISLRTDKNRSFGTISFKLKFGDAASPVVRRAGTKLTRPGLKSFGNARRHGIFERLNITDGDITRSIATADEAFQAVASVLLERLAVWEPTFETFSRVFSNVTQSVIAPHDTTGTVAKGRLTAYRPRFTGAFVRGLGPTDLITGN